MQTILAVNMNPRPVLQRILGSTSTEAISLGSLNKYMNKKGIDVGREAMTGPENAIILTAKAMSVGARITDGQKSFIRREYKRCGLNREGIEQVGKALDEYVSGTPYKLPEPDRSTHNIHDSHESARSEAG